MRLELRDRLHLPDTGLYPFGEWYPGLPPTKFGSLRPPLPIDMLEHINTSFAFGTLELSSHRVDKFWDPYIPLRPLQVPCVASGGACQNLAVGRLVQRTRSITLSVCPPALVNPTTL